MKITITASTINTLTADTLTKMFYLLSNDSFYEEILHKFLPKKDERNEFRQMLHLSICEMPKVLTYWNNGFFKWIYIKMIKNNVCSSTSRWHYQMRKKDGFGLYEDIENFQIEEITEETEFEIELQDKIQNKINLIDSIVEQKTKEIPILIRDFKLFRMYYNENLTYRKIAKKTGISLMAVHSYVKNAREIIQKEIQKQT